MFMAMMIAFCMSPGTHVNVLRMGLTVQFGRASSMRMGGGGISMGVREGIGVFVELMLMVVMIAMTFHGAGHEMVVVVMVPALDLRPQ